MNIDPSVLTKKFIQGAKKNPESFGRLFDEYYRPIFGYTLRRIADVDLAQDLTSETFFKALKNFNQFQWRNEKSFGNWLFKIATNEINMHFRKNKNIISLDNDNFNFAERLPSSDGFMPDTEIILAQEELQKKEDFLRVNKELRKLKVEYQTVITLKYFEKKKIEQISQILDKPEGTIKSWIHRGLRDLRELLKSSETV